MPASDALSADPFPNQPPGFLIRFGLLLRRMLQALVNRLFPAEFVLFEQSVGIQKTVAIGVAARHRMPDVLAAGPLTAAEIATRCGTNADATHRTLRALATIGVFKLRSDGRFENNRLSNALRSGTLSRLRHWADYYSSPTHLAAWSDFDRLVREGRGGFSRIHGMSVWDWFSQHPDEETLFANAMMGVTVQDAPILAGLYPFGEIKRLCDVGGGRGTLLSELLIRHPHLRGVLCDAPGVLESARDLLTRRGLLDRVELVAGNFFESVPSGHDAYLMKNVLHDWDDPSCRRILSNCRRAMAPGQRLLLVEMLVDRNDTSWFGSISDLQMMVICDDGRERGAKELQALLTETGFKPSRVFKGPLMGVVEGIAA